MIKYVLHLILVVLSLSCVSCESNRTEKRIEKISNNGGKVLYHTSNAKEDTILYKTKEGLYIWKTSDKEPRDIFANVDEVSIKSFFYTVEVEKSAKKESSISLKKMKHSETSNRENYLTDEEKEDMILVNIPNVNISIQWPWIIVDDSYIFHIDDPTTLLKIKGLSAKDISIQTNGHDKLILKRKFYKTALPGFRDYQRTTISDFFWETGTYYYGGRNWWEASSFLEKLELFDDVEEGLKTICRQSNIPEYFDQIIIYNNSNKENIFSYEWGPYSISQKDFNYLSLIPTYRAAEEEQNKEAIRWKKDMEGEMVSIMRKKAVNSWEMIGLFKNNPYKAAEKYPVGKMYYINAGATKIRPSDNGYKYEIGCDFNDLTILLSDNSGFTRVEYPSNVLVCARLEGLIPYKGYDRLVFTEADIFDAQKPEEY